MISLTFVRISNCSHGIVGRTTGFRSRNYGVESQALPTFFNFINTTENRDNPFLCMRSFEARNFLKPRMVPYEISWYCETKKFRRINVITPIHLIHKLFYTPEKFWYTERFPHEVFRHCETKKSWTKKSWFPPLSFAENIEISGGIDICRKLSKNDISNSSLVFDWLIKIFLFGQKICRC